MCDSSNAAAVQVTYLALREPPKPAIKQSQVERIALERLAITQYLTLYRRVGESMRWDQRLKMPEGELRELLDGDSLCIYVLRDPDRHALGLCEFELLRLPEIELKNFGLVPEAYGRRLGPWLLAEALYNVWEQYSPSRIWLHTDTSDHPAALPVYQRAGFQVYDVRQQAPGEL